MKAAWLAASLLGACALIAACREHESMASDPMAELAGRNVVGLRLRRAEDRGHQLFTNYCVTCHGEQGAGDGQNASRLQPRPPDLRTALQARGPEYAWRVIQSGTAAMGRSPMCPPRGRQLNPDQIDSLVSYLQVLVRERR
jgi:mono/diheme cytochrome c family protein